jgi:hypothetical protein
MQKTKRGLCVAVAAAGLVAAGAGVASANSDANGTASNSPGVLSGNLLQVPLHVPVNLCGNSITVIGALNPAFGNTCTNS